ncbi:MAG: FG-GAP-like repeat-containing protein [Bacteroidota bacterium]
MEKLLNAILLILGSSIFFTNCAQNTSEKPTNIKFKKYTLTKDFISEGVAVGDINKDGRTDIIAGSFWFEAPNWTKHQYSKTVFYGAGMKEKEKIAVDEGYCNSFLNFTMDVNRDGWMDIIRVGLPGEESEWYENNQNKTSFWKAHKVHPSIGNESPAFVDVDGDRRNDLIFADSKSKKVVWLSAPTSKKDTLWHTYVISNDSLQSTHRYTHGLGFGDVNLDGKKDVIVREGWWESPKDPKTPNWKFHKTDIGEEASQMYAMDLDGDGDQDIISASAHKYGMWWHEASLSSGEGRGEVKFKHHEFSKVFSQTHNLSLVDVNDDGNLDLVTGKRFFAHNGKDPGAFEAKVLYWFEYEPGSTPKWHPHLIDSDSGAGLQNVVLDMNKDKRKDIVVANKNGVYYFEQIKN